MCHYYIYYPHTVINTLFGIGIEFFFLLFGPQIFSLSFVPDFFGSERQNCFFLSILSSFHFLSSFFIKQEAIALCCPILIMIIMVNGYGFTIFCAGSVRPPYYCLRDVVTNIVVPTFISTLPDNQTERERGRKSVNQRKNRRQPKKKRNALFY